MLKIRRKKKYTGKYSYSDRSGVCKGEKHAVKGAVFFSHSKVTKGSKGWYNGLCFLLTGMALKKCMPVVGYMWDIIVIGTEWENKKLNENLKICGTEALGMSTDYLSKYAKNNKIRVAAGGFGYLLDIKAIYDAITDDKVRVGDDAVTVAINRGYKQPLTRSQINQSIMEFVARDDTLVYAQTGGEFEFGSYSRFE